MSVVPGCEGDSDVAAEGKKRGFEGGTNDEVASGGVPTGVAEAEDVVVLGGGVGVGDNRLIRGLLLALDLVGWFSGCERSQTLGSYLYKGPKELSIDR